MKPFFIDVAYGCKKTTDEEKVSDRDLALINKLPNGPLKQLTADDVIVRGILILGEHKTSKGSCHPENKKIGKRTFKSLSDLNKVSVGAPMMIGHNTDLLPWGRVFESRVRDDVPGHEYILEHRFYCLNDEEGRSLMNKVDCGIISEGSISFSFKTVCCSVCGGILMSMDPKRKVEGCAHRIGQSYDGVECLWIPYDIASVRETSFVFRGAYPKTKCVGYSDEDLETGLKNLGLLESSENETENPDPMTLQDTLEIPIENEAITTTPDPTTNSNPPTPSSTIENSEENGENGGEGGGKTAQGGALDASILSSEHQDEVLGGSQTAPESASENNAVEIEASAAAAALQTENDPDASSEESEYYEDESNTEIQTFNEVEMCVGCGTVYSDAVGTCEDCGYSVVTVDLSVKLFKPVGANKPKKAGTVNNEFYDVQGFKSLPSGSYIVEPKYNGIFIEAHRDGDMVKLYTDEGNEVSDRFPSILSELKNSELKQFIIVGEMTQWKGRKRMSHEDVAGYIHRKDAANDTEMRYKPFDIVFDGSDIREESLSKRRAVLDKNIKWGKQVHPTMYTLVKHVQGGNRIVNAIADRQTREGAMVKNVNYTYTPSGRGDIMKWKRQYHVDCTVVERKDKEGGGYVYSCSVGRGKDTQHIGSTFPTKIVAENGETLTVSVDYVLFNEKTGKYSWFAPKVIANRGKKVPDPLSLVKRIAEIKNIDSQISLSDVVPRLKTAECMKVLYICGGVVERGYSEHDLDILVKEELTEAERASILSVLGESIAQRTEIVYDPVGATGPHIAIECDLAASKPKWEYANKFVLQEHFWGDKKHYDLRFGAPSTKKMWGWTCLNKPAYSENDPKVRCLEKNYHDPKWMAIDKKVFKPGEEGNPTKNHTAYMNSLDRGDYKFISRKPGYLEMVLDGKHMKGRYIWREIDAKESTNAEDETGTKSNKIWILWKPKDQTPGGKVKKLAYKWDKSFGMFLVWETEDYEA